MLGGVVRQPDTSSALRVYPGFYLFWRVRYRGFPVIDGIDIRCAHIGANVVGAYRRQARLVRKLAIAANRL